MRCCLARVYENVNKWKASGEVDKVLILQSILANTSYFLFLFFFFIFSKTKITLTHSNKKHKHAKDRTEQHISAQTSARHK